MVLHALTDQPMVEERQDRSFPNPLTRLDEGVPKSLLFVFCTKGFEQEDLRLSAPLPRAKQSRGDNAGVVDHQEVGREKVIEKMVEAPML